MDNKEAARLISENLKNVYGSVCEQNRKRTARGSPFFFCVPISRKRKEATP